MYFFKENSAHPVLAKLYSLVEFKNEKGVVAKYYYDDVTLRYVKIIDENGKEEIIQVEKISTKIPEDMFKIPEGKEKEAMNDAAVQWCYDNPI